VSRRDERIILPENKFKISTTAGYIRNDGSNEIPMVQCTFLFSIEAIKLQVSAFQRFHVHTVGQFVHRRAAINKTVSQNLAWRKFPEEISWLVSVINFGEKKQRTRPMSSQKLIYVCARREIKICWSFIGQT
jgi:hypothetical protein